MGHEDHESHQDGTEVPAHDHCDDTIAEEEQEAATKRRCCCFKRQVQIQEYKPEEPVGDLDAEEEDTIFGVIRNKIKVVKTFYQQEEGEEAQPLNENERR